MTCFIIADIQNCKKKPNRYWNRFKFKNKQIVIVFTIIAASVENILMSHNFIVWSFEFDSKYLASPWNKEKENVLLNFDINIITKVVSSNPVHGEVYSIQRYVIKFVSDLRQVCGFFQILIFPPSIKMTTII